MSLVMTGQDQYVCVVMFSFVYFNPEVPKQTAALEHAQWFKISELICYITRLLLFCVCIKLMYGPAHVKFYDSIKSQKSETKRVRLGGCTNIWWLAAMESSPLSGKPWAHQLPWPRHTHCCRMSCLCAPAWQEKDIRGKLQMMPHANVTTEASGVVMIPNHLLTSIEAVLASDPQTRLLQNYSWLFHGSLGRIH